jgi:hypothetical protein
MRPGSVFLWKNYPFQEDREVKNRWFICLGEEKSDPLETNAELIFIIAATTTSQVEFYEEYRERGAHPHIKFDPRPDLGFTSSCILDLFFEPDVLAKAAFQKYVNQGEIEEKGLLSEAELRNVYEKICSSSAYSPILKKTIQHNFRAVGIAGLAEPERRRKKR